MSHALLHSFLLNHVVVFTLLLARVGGLVSTAPIFSSSAMPIRLRALLAVAISLVLLPTFGLGVIPRPGSTLQYAVLVGTEFLLGLVIGLGVLIFFSGVQVAGQVIGQLSGMALADVFNPTFDSNSPIFSQLLFFIALAVFLLFDGHRMVMVTLLDTFVVIPPGEAYIGESVAHVLTDALAQSFVVGIRAAAPAMTALLLSTFILGLISRTLPQLNIIAIGFGLNSLITMSALFLSLGGICLLFQEQIVLLLDELQQALISDHTSR